MITDQQIKELAYAIWEQEGRPDGDDWGYYFRAKQILEEQEAALLAAAEPVSPVSKPKKIVRPKPIAKRTVKRQTKKE